MMPLNFFEELVAYVAKVVQENGDITEFDYRAWTLSWVQMKNPALGGALPSEYLDTPERFETVKNIIDCMIEGSYH
jgi:hypothetical protein